MIKILLLNIQNIFKNVYFNCHKDIDDKNIEETFDNESTNKSFFSTTHLNPLFSFHKIKNEYKDDKKDDIDFYENICNDLIYSEISNKGNKKNEIDKNNYNDMVEEKIRNLVDEDIFSILNK